MSERTEYAAGTPSWADNASPDPGAAAEFYSGLFGWQTEDRMPDDQAGEYHMATLRGKDVAALGSQPMEGVPPLWNTYVTVDDVDATAEKVPASRGTVLMDPFDVMDVGRMAVLQDPAGAVFMAWEAKGSIGAELVNEPGTMCWNELITGDTEGAKEFYAAVFGWQTSTMEGDGPEYTIWHPAGVEPNQAPQEQGGNGLGGLMSNEQMPPGTPPFWMVYFAVSDTDETVAKAEELGGAVMAPAFDAPGVGRIAVLTDSQGAAFSVIAMSSAD